jgi:hypothetical protein
MLKIHETASAAGLLSVFLRFEHGVLVLDDATGSYPLPHGALDAVMARYGAPWDPQARVALVATLALPAGCSLAHVRHLAGYDVIARDYLIYRAVSGEASCALATTLSAALCHLAHAAAAAASTEAERAAQ